MASQVNHLPHILNTKAGNNKWDPMHKAIFEVYFTLPEAISSTFKSDEAILTEQVTKVTGLDQLNRVVEAGQQKFLGVDVSYLNPTLANTYGEITITLNLNLRNATDAYVFKIFKAWGKLGYDLADGTRTLMAQYCADNMRIAEANRNGAIWRAVVMHKILLTKISGLDDLDYTANDARTLECTFRFDYWDEDIA